MLLAVFLLLQKLSIGHCTIKGGMRNIAYSLFVVLIHYGLTVAVYVSPRNPFIASLVQQPSYPFSPVQCFDARTGRGELGLSRCCPSQYVILRGKLRRLTHAV